MRLLTLSLALAFSGSLAGVALTGSAATAANPKPSDKCKQLKANLRKPNGKLSKCKSDGPADVPPEGEVFGVGVFPTALLLGGPGPFNIAWNGPANSEYSGTQTQVNGVAVSFVENDVDAPCPAATPQERELTGIIGPNDSASNDAGGTFAAELCVNVGNGTVTLEPNTVVAFGEGPNS